MTNLTNITDCEYYDMLIKAVKKEIEYHIGVAREYKTIDTYIAEVNINAAEKELNKLEKLYAECGK